MQSTSAPRVVSYAPEQVRFDRWPVVLLHYSDSRGHRRTSECKFNDVAAAKRHGERLLGLPVR